MKLKFSAFIILLSVAAAGYAENAGSRGSYTRGGWAGAEYAATGMAGEVLADDVFAIYWNPAGLTELRAKKKLTEKQITEKAKQGNIEDITEEDLLNFSESDANQLFFNVGASYTKLDIERDAGFAGCAFNFFKGVIGAGLYSITSSGIETRNDSGTLTGTRNYSGSAGFLSYAIQWNIISFGVSAKGYYESIGESTYSGAGADAGFQIFLLPFIKLGVMVRDAGGFLKPQDAPESENRYDFFKPQIKTGIAFLSDAGVKIALSGSKKLEQTGFEYGAGVEYDISKFLTVNTGITDNYFSAGFTLKLMGMDVAYAINYDKIDFGYNNTVSLALLF
ncbi:MAG TPA: hypothetical protein PKG60_11215 [Spirochaetota bacterium]|nr:hypothetical protein [Spirochaetota bacterium]HPS87682.1 hypothetical protein [Spirochaetota bacterium]